MSENSSECVYYETESWDLWELITSYVCKKVHTVAQNYRESQRVQRWDIALALTCNDLAGREAPRTVFKSKVYVICNQEDIVQSAVDCIEDLRKQILDFGQEFDQMQPRVASSQQQQQPDQPQNPEST